MTLSLAQLQSEKKVQKRRGRGHGSGLGTYSGRGVKGQKARSGGKFKGGHGGKRFPSFIQKTPKQRGFRSLNPKLAVVNLKQLQSAFADGEMVTPKLLFSRGLIVTPRFGVKILGEGTLSKKLNVHAQKFSNSAKDAIMKAGGKIVELKKETPKREEKNTKAK